MFSTTNIAEAKKLFRKLAMRLHPDHGGSDELMRLLHEAYDRHIRLLESEEFSAFLPNADEENLKYPESNGPVGVSDERIKIIDEILAYADEHESFDPSFTLEMKKKLEQKHVLTSGQYNALTRVYYKFRMHKKE